MRSLSDSGSGLVGRFSSHTRSKFADMTSLQNRPNTALVVIDMQREVVANAFGVDGVVANINTLVVTGAQTDACIRSTLHGALARGYDATLVADAHTSEDMRQWGSPISPDQAIAVSSFSRSAAADHAPNLRRLVGANNGYIGDHD